MNSEWPVKRARLGLIVPLVLVIIVADQLSKALFVYLLGTHKSAGFGEFSAGYFSLWGANGSTGAINAHYFPFKPGIDVWTPWIEFNLTTNTGAAWSMFAGNSFVLSGVSLVMAVLLVYVWWRSFRFHISMTWALGGIIGGALGNFLDRFRLKEVVDFIDVRLPLIGRVFPGLGDPYDFPIFNIADSCAVLGTLALAVYLIAADIRSMRSKHRQATQKPTAGHVDDSEKNQVERAPVAEQDSGSPPPEGEGEHVGEVNSTSADGDGQDESQRP